MMPRNPSALHWDGEGEQRVRGEGTRLVELREGRGMVSMTVPFPFGPGAAPLPHMGDPGSDEAPGPNGKES